MTARPRTPRTGTTTPGPARSCPWWSCCDLEADGFATYSASGGDRDYVRPFAEELYGIPPERVIGSALGLGYQASDDDTKLLYKSKIDFFDDGPEKPVPIWSGIGRRPLIASGNSNADVPTFCFARVDDAHRCDC